MYGSRKRRSAGQENSGDRSLAQRTHSAAAMARGSLEASSAQALQRSIGNAAFARLMSERRQHGAERGDDGEEQRRAADEVGSVVRSAGSRLAPALRREMEARFEGEDFSDVTVHTGSTARRSAEAVGAEAFTTGTNHIVFRSVIDKKTLAHELEHVRQQRAGAVAGTDDGSGLRISDPCDRFEKSAERKAEQVMGGTAEVQRSATQASCAAAPHQTAEPSTAVQRTRKKKSTPNVPAEDPASEKSEFEKIVEYFEEYSAAFKAKKPNEKDDILEALCITRDDAIYTLSEIETSEDLLTEFSAAVETSQYASGYAGPGGGSSDWATSAVTAKHRDMRLDYPYWGDKTTLHHKISRSELDTILAAAERDAENAKPLFEFLDEIRVALGGSTAGDKKALHNMPANLEMGPASDTRIGDPGSGTDFNFTPEGSMTPRSKQLSEALSLANQPSVDWEALADKLREAQRIQEQEHEGAILSKPALERWKQVGSKWEKKS